MKDCNSVRVTWLERAWEELREQFLPDAPETAAITVGFPPKNPKKVVGFCWSGWTEGEGFFICLHPLLFPDRVQVLEVMLHEMVHAKLDNKHGHKRPFAKICDKLGFIGPPTHNTAGPDLRVKLEALAEKLGPITPGKGAFEIKDTKKKQSTRMRKYTCPGCQQILRAAKDGLKIVHLDCSDEPFEQEEPEAADEAGEKSNAS